MFRPGETVRGQVFVTLTDDPHPRSVTLQAIGVEYTNWGTQPTYIARTHALDQHIDLWRPAREGETLPAGAHTFPFAIDLPATLPPSFDGILTEIGYGLKVKVDLPRHIDLHAEAGFIVLAATSVGDKPAASAEARDADGRQLRLELTQSVYRLGEAIGGTVSVAGLDAGGLRRVTVELVARERASAQGIWMEHVEREADLRVELEHVAADSMYTFQFRIPDSAMPAFTAEHSELAWYVTAQLNVARSPDLTVEAKIIVIEPD